MIAEIADTPGSPRPEIAITVSGLGKRYRLGAAKKKSVGLGDHLREFADLFRRSTEEERDTIWALDRISFEICKGERVGIIGRNGAGKSTLLKVMSRIVPPTTGEVRIYGRLTSLLEVGTGFNDNLTGRENIYLNASLYGLSRSEVAARFEAIVDFSEVRRFIDTPVKAYSSGMKMRLAFSVAAHLDPDILLMDEVLAVGDMAFQRKCLEKVDNLTSGGRTLFFVSHSMDAVMRYCDRCLWMDSGRVRMDGPSAKVVAAYVEAVLGVRSSVSKVTRGSVEAVPADPDADGHPTVTALNEVEASVVSAVKIAAAAPSRTAKIITLPPRQTAAELDIHPTVIPEASAFLVDGSVRDREATEKTMFRVDEPVYVHIAYRISEPGMYLPAIHVFCPQGTLAFVSCPPDSEPERFRVHEPGLFSAAVEIPPHLLNIGTYRISIVVFSPDESPFKRHFTAEQALSFHCVDVGIGEFSARGLIPRTFPGPLRPLLEWAVTEHEAVEDKASQPSSTAGQTARR